MDMVKYHRLITAMEETDWFRERVRNRELEINYRNNTGICNTGILGQFTENGFLISCEHLAVTYNVSPKVAVDKNWHTLRHINQRNNITAVIMGIICRIQGKYLLTHDPITLRRLPYQRIVDEYKHQFPKGYMDQSIISRVVRNKAVLLDRYREIPVTELLPRKSYIIGFRIKQLLDTINPLLTDTELQIKLRDRFDLQLTRRYVSYCRNLMGIPEARLRKKTDSNFFHWDSAVQNLFCLKRWVQSLRLQVFMGLA